MPYLTHGEVFDEMWDYSREGDKCRSDFEALAYYCMDQAAAGVPCILHGAQDYPMVKFVCAMQDDRYAPILAQVFSTFVRHGLLKPNERLVLSQDCPLHYKKLFGYLPLMQAVLRGNIHAAELLVLHGANTTMSVDEVSKDGTTDFFDFVKLRFGESHFLPLDPNERAAAAARLVEAAMKWRISNIEVPALDAGPRAIRRSRSV